MVGALSLAVELENEENKFESQQELREFIVKKFEYLETARKTACNLSKAKDSVLSFLDEIVKEEEDLVKIKVKVVKKIKNMLKEDREYNEAIGKHGAQEVLSIHPDNVERKFNILTHCNTGSLATAGYGTALGVVRRLHELKRLECVYCTETRPYNQGSRLTAYELVVEKIPGTLIADSMAAAAMKEKKIDAIIVGADRIAKNGDVANKIGTLQLAIAAKYLEIPFYVAATKSTVDLSTESGDKIEIELRSDIELVAVAGIRIAAPGIATWNPAFDVTPADLITGIITETGVIKPQDIAKEFDKDV
jgi:methylthioribose-1-phosphate isomerase